MCKEDLHGARHNLMLLYRIEGAWTTDKEALQKELQASFAGQPMTDKNAPGQAKERSTIFKELPDRMMARDTAKSTDVQQQVLPDAQGPQNEHQEPSTEVRVKSEEKAASLEADDEEIASSGGDIQPMALLLDYV